MNLLTLIIANLPPQFFCTTNIGASANYYGGGGPASPQYVGEPPKSYGGNLRGGNANVRESLKLPNSMVKFLG